MLRIIFIIIFFQQIFLFAQDHGNEDKVGNILRKTLSCQPRFRKKITEHLPARRLRGIQVIGGGWKTVPVETVMILMPGK